MRRLREALTIVVLLGWITTAGAQMKDWEELKGKHFVVQYPSPAQAAMARQILKEEIGRASCRERVCQYV